MTIQFSVAVRNARLDAIESAISTSAILKIRSGAQPGACATADSGTVLATINLASDYMSNASAGATGTAGHFRIYASDGTTCHMQGSITLTSGGGDMELDNTSLTATQQF